MEDKAIESKKIPTTGKKAYKENSTEESQFTLTTLIKKIEKGVKNKSSFVSTIKDPKMLVRSLNELNSLIGNKSIKDSVASQITHLIVMKKRIEEGTMREDDVMLNTVLYGPPGVGKTLVGTKLAKIWHALGYIQKPKKKTVGKIFKEINTGQSDGSDYISILIIVLAIYWVLAMINNVFGKNIMLIALGGLFIGLLFAAVYYYYDSADNNPEVPMTELRKKIKKEKEDSEYVKIVKREDFVGEYVGWTAPKTKKLLEDNLGKVIIVDEAYSLINGPRDEFGMEALTTLNLFMSERHREIIVIFLGYKDLLENGVYSAQPGLKRRFMWQFDCEGYNGEELYQIFKMQLEKKGWNLSDEQKIKELISTNSKFFPAYGGDTERAAFFSELEHSKDYVSGNDSILPNTIEPSHVKKGIETLIKNNFKENPKKPSQMDDILKYLSDEKSRSSL